MDDLRKEHARLEAEIDEENNRPHPDEALLSGLKRQKLRIKDQLAESSMG